MKFAFHFHATRSYWRSAAPSAALQSWIFQWARAAGFDGVDISDSWNLRNLPPHELADIGARVQDAGLALPTLSSMGKTLHAPDLGAHNLASLLASLDVAHALEVPLVNLSLSTPRIPGVTPTFGVANTPGGSRGASDQDFDITIQRLQTLCRKADTLGIRLSLELHDRSLADSPASLIRILDAVGSDTLGANPDLTNGYRAYDTPDDTWQSTLEQLAPRTNLWHINNLQRVHVPDIARSVFVEAALGEGDIDYRWALNVMRHAGFDGWVVIENKSSRDTFELSQAGIRYMKALLSADAMP